jgi:hypothetical protein
VQVTRCLEQFIVCFNQLTKKPVTQSTIKTRASPKRGRRNVDDTDTEDDDDDNQQVSCLMSSWIEEWKLYVNTYKVIPDDMGIVQWWGVSSQLVSFA